MNTFNWMSGEARQEQKPQFDQQGNDCTLTAIMCALRLRCHELIVQCELSDVIALQNRSAANSIRDTGKWLAELLAFAGVKRESSAPLNFVASCAELRFLARVDARWCRREKYKQIRRKTLLYAFERRTKACQSAWRRQKYKPTLTRIENILRESVQSTVGRLKLHLSRYFKKINLILFNSKHILPIYS